jgi:hypothetical protein
MPIQGDQRASSPRSKIDRGRAILPSISGERRIRQGQYNIGAEYVVNLDETGS